MSTHRRRLWSSRSPGKVVVRYADGRLVKGYSYDFEPDRPSFHVVPPEASVEGGIEVWVKDLKAVFFVKSFEGDPGYTESKELYRERPASTRKLLVEFEDGEVLVGRTRGYEPAGGGFYFVPMDPQSNNRRVFAVLSGVSSVKRLL